MLDLHSLHLHLGAALAPDGIPLHYGDLAGEYQTALAGVVIMDRSHEGRLEMVGKDRLALMHRISTNDLLALATGQGAPTIFTNPNGRILDRVTVYHRGETALVLTEPGRGDSVNAYLQRNIFFNDDARARDLAPSTRQIVLHGPAADAAVEAAFPGLSALAPLAGQALDFDGEPLFAARLKPLLGAAWTFIAPNGVASQVFSALLMKGKARPAGSLTYNALRIRAGRPGVGRELSTDYIPLEVGLWDEVSFQKGCYTGQEIIARMESRGRLAKTIVALQLDSPVEAPAPLLHEGREVGRLTSSVVLPTSEVLGIGVLRLALAQPGTLLRAGEGTARVTRLTGVQPAALMQEDEA